jgi:aspartate racemase
MDLPDKIIGIVGGMGPRAGVALCNSIVSQTAATMDQEHFSIVLLSFPGEIVDRTAFLEGRSAVNPALNIAGIIRKLEAAGAGVAGIACNTCHSPLIFDVLLEELNKTNCGVQLLHMPVETCRFIREDHPYIRRVGVMTTNGTYRSGVYVRVLEDHGYEIVNADPGFQNDVIHRMVYDANFGLKSCPRGVTPEVKALMDTALDYFRMQGAEAVILGCTELSLVEMADRVEGLLVVDSTAALARALIREASRYSATPTGDF